MAVQKSKKSRSRRGMRRSHDALTTRALSIDPIRARTFELAPRPFLFRSIAIRRLETGKQVPMRRCGGGKERHKNETTHNMPVGPLLGLQAQGRWCRNSGLGGPYGCSGGNGDDHCQHFAASAFQ